MEGPCIGDSRGIDSMSAICATLLAAWLIYLLGADALAGIFYPAPHDYGEGVLGWMTMEIFHLRIPYGNITEIPSQYACYGPLPAAAAAGLSAFLPESPMRFFVAGRALGYIYWGVSGVLLGALCRPRLAPFLFIPVVALAVSHTAFVCSFRVDSMGIMLQSAILFTLCRVRGRPLYFVLPALISLIVLVKPTAALDIPPILLLGAALQPRAVRLYVKEIAIPAILGIIAAPTIYFLIDWAIFDGWMSNNTLWVQKASGWAEPYSPAYMMITFFLSPTIWAFMVWALLGAFSPPERKSRLAAAGIAIAILINGSLALKYGAVTNYYFPLVVLMTGAATSVLRTNAQVLVFLGALALSSTVLHKLIKVEHCSIWA